MKIAVWHNLPSGGGKRALFDHVSGLVGHGHHVEAWCPPGADQQFLRLSELIPEHVIPLNFDHQGWASRRLDWISGGATGTLARLKALEEHTKRCAEAINRSGSDVLLATSAAGFAVTGLAKYLDVPSVLYLQEPLRWLHEAGPGFPWPAREYPHRGGLKALLQVRDAVRIEGLRVQLREEIAGAKAYDRVLSNSYFSRESILRSYRVDSRVCYLGVDTNRYADRGRRREHMVVGIGAFIPYKRIEAAVAAVSTLPVPRPTLTWIGNAMDGGYLEKIRQMAARSNVEFTPLVGIPHSQVVEVLNRAAAMVYAPHLEPFGYAPIEAAACGVPVVAKAEGGVRESVVDGVTGLLVETDADLGVALERILSDDVLRQTMRESARANAASAWSLEASTLRLESHLIEMASLT